METALLKVLRLLRESAELLTKEDITERLEEEESYVNRALEKLRKEKVITKVGQYYSYQRTEANERFSEKILAVYNKITRGSEGELVVIGLLSTATRYRYLLRRNALLNVLEKEGFDSGRLNNFLEEEVKAGRIKKIKVVLVNKGGVRFPPVIPSGYLSRFWMRTNEYEEFKKRWIGKGFAVQEEDYLIASFPPDLANQGREYLEKAHIKQRISGEVFGGKLLRKKA